MLIAQHIGAYWERATRGGICAYIRLGLTRRRPRIAVLDFRPGICKYCVYARESWCRAINTAPHKHDGYVIRTARSRRARLFPLTIEVGPIATDGCDVTVHRQPHSAKSMKYLTALLIPSVVHESAPRRKFISREVPLLARTRELDPRVSRQLSNFCDISLRYPLCTCITLQRKVFSSKLSSYSWQSGVT